MSKKQAAPAARRYGNNGSETTRYCFHKGVRFLLKYFQLIYENNQIILPGVLIKTTRKRFYLTNEQKENFY